MKIKSSILWFEKLSMRDISRVGGKNASLGELTRSLARHGVNVPPGFATTAQVYRQDLLNNGAHDVIDRLMTDLNLGKISLALAGKRARAAILTGHFTPSFEKELAVAYARLSKRMGARQASVAVRSSATAEDLPDASFAGQQDTYLNVVGLQALLKTCRRCFASLYTDRAISYRRTKGFKHESVALSVGVQAMVRSDKASSGVMFSLDSDSGFPGVVLISGAWGLGENVVQGAVDPDEWLVHKAGLATAKRLNPIIKRSLGSKNKRMVFALAGIRNTNTTLEERRAWSLADTEVLTLARWATRVEKHYGKPMDMEWAKDGVSKKLYLVQARPETVHSRGESHTLKSFQVKTRNKAIVEGAAVGEGAVSGIVCRVRSAKDITRFKPGSILVAEMTDPDWVPLMKQARGIITDHGGRTCHAAIVSRELGVPAIVGAQNAMRRLRDGQAITLSCAEGAVGRVYTGALPIVTRQTDMRHLPRPKTKIFINLASPDAAFKSWRLPADGVGLARMEFIVSNAIKAHPMALLRWPRLSDRSAIQAILALTKGWPDKKEFFVQKLAEGLAQIAATRYPRPVIVRLSDFKTNEYANLLGGAEFEPKEENPMLGWRGASRYYDPRYREGFALECRALRLAREKMGLDNIIVMVPFCRTPEEADLVLKEMARHGLRRGVKKLKVYVMAEIPSNILRCEEFAQRFDGFSIGSNDLTQLTLGVDRDSSDLTKRFDERDPAVKILISDLIRRAHRVGRVVGICGQAPSDHPGYPAFLVKAGIDSVSLNPDSVVAGFRRIYKAEQKRR